MFEMNKDLGIQSAWPLPIDPIDTPCTLSKPPSTRPSSDMAFSHAPTPLIIPEPIIPPYQDDLIPESAMSQSTDALHALLDDSESDSEPDSDLELDLDLEGPDPVVETLPLSPSPSSPSTRPTFSSPLSYSCTSFDESLDSSEDVPDSCHTYTIQYSPPRHQYTDHGYSRQGFSHIRRFWELREDAWAYDGYSPELSEEESITPPSMHPRRGDVSALRDPYCAHVDRCFAKLPVWTMSKTLWMFDIHVGATRPKAIPKSASTDSETENEEDMFGSIVSVKTKASEDSDSTLVESESEDGWSVVSPSSSTPISPSSSQPSRSPSCYFEEEPPKKLFDEEDEDEEEDSSDEEDENEYACVPRVWATNWYRRWELLIRLVRLDQERKRSRAAKLLAQSESDPEGVGT